MSNFTGQDKEIYVFVGEKIEVKEFQPKEMLMDRAFKAKYRILEQVYGRLNLDVIAFEAYDHYGIPPFSNYKHVLLYVVKIDGKFYHSKYQYSALYKTKGGEWAGTYALYDYNHIYNEHTTIEPVKIDFEPAVEFDLSKYRKEMSKDLFPEPYFEINGDKATAVYGHYIEDLFQLKKNGVLKARGYFFP
ncbi:hypothetical protein [Winogradskyella sp. 3972H.M.0a.05]|uniref:hypothetical protein n=1 Tax=Winogradskyella sp. 3972H.M.0a.05 TaxID=2950277 RepID=UPI0033953F4B